MKVNFWTTIFSAIGLGLQGGEHFWPPTFYLGSVSQFHLVLCSCLSHAPDIQKSEMPGKERKRQQAAMSSSLPAAPDAPTGPFFHGGVQAPRVAMTSGLEIPHWLPQGMDAGLWCIPAMLPPALAT